MPGNISPSFKKRRFVFSFVAFFALLLAGCATSNTNAARLAADQTFIWPITHATTFNDLIVDPPNTPDVYSAGVLNLIFGHLVSMDQNLNVIPDMATSWNISQDGKEYTFHLRADLHFSDGTPLTAQDFAYSIDRALDPQVCVPFVGLGCRPRSTSLFDIVGATDRVAGRIPSLIGNSLVVQDAQTLLIKLAHPAAHFLEAMTTNAVVPVEHGLIDKYGVDHKGHKDWTYHLDVGGCSGPFLLQPYEGNSTTLTFTPNPYWHGPKLTLKRIIRPLVYDLTDSYAGYKAGKYDYTDVPTQDYLSARDQGDFHEIGLLSVQFLGINQLASPFNDLRVRQAFALAINKQLLVDRVLSGALVPTNHIVPQGQPGFYAGLSAPGSSTRTVTGDSAKAQALIKDYFAQCGCSSLTVTITYPDDARRAPVAQAMIQMWNTILSGSWGQVKVIPQPVGFQTLVNQQFNATLGHAGPLQMWLIGLSTTFPDPYNWFNIFAPTAPLNVFNYRDDGNQYTAWALTQKADAEPDQEKRMALYNQVEQQLVNAALEIPYAQEKALWRLRSYIQGFNLTPLQTVPIPELAWANVSVLEH